MNADIEKMIRFATEDGSITDGEREIIIRKAQEMGADIDEVEIMLENELAKHNKVVEPPKPAIQRSKEKVKKCPNCGAAITESMLTCPECGYDFSTQSDTSEDIQKRIERLQEMLENVDKEEMPVKSFDVFGMALLSEKRIQRKASIISTFTMPTTKEGLLQFLDFAYSNFSTMDKTGGGDDIRNAWKGKAKMAYNMLRRYGNTDDEVSSIISYYDKLFKAEERKLSKATMLLLFIIGFILFGLLMIFYFAK